MMFREDEVTKTVEPFGDGMEIEITYQPAFFTWMNYFKMPTGIKERAENGSTSEKDVAYFMWVVDEHTDQDFKDLMERDDISNKKVGYIVELVLSEFAGDYDLESWEERVESDSSFIDNESLGVQ